MPNNEPVIPSAKSAEPVTCNEPLVVTTPIKVCVSKVALSPNKFEPDEKITDDETIFVINTFTLAVPVINTLEAVAFKNVGLNPLAIVSANDAVVAFCACEALIAVEAKLALVALVANDELIDALTLFITLVNVVPSPLVNVIVSLLLDAVRTLFNANDAVVANDELVVVFDVEANEAETAFCA